MNTRQLLAALRATVSPIRVISANIDNDENAQSFIRDLTGKFKARYTRISRSHLLTLPAPLDHKVFGNLLLNVLKNHGGKRRSATSHWDEFQVATIPTTTGLSSQVRTLRRTPSWVSSNCTRTTAKSKFSGHNHKQLGVRCDPNQDTATQRRRIRGN